MKVKSKLLSAIVLVALGLATYAGNALATPPAGFSGTTLAKATYGKISSHVHIPKTWDELIRTKGLSDLYVQQNTWQPGGSTGWHTHPGPSFVIVTQGSVTVYDGNDPTARRTSTPRTPPTTSSSIRATATSTSSGTRPAPWPRRSPCSSSRPGAVRREDAPKPGNCSF